jgi:hypothetical protein
MKHTPIGVLGAMVVLLSMYAPWHPSYASQSQKFPILVDKLGNRFELKRIVSESICYRVGNFCFNLPLARVASFQGQADSGRVAIRTTDGQTIEGESCQECQNNECQLKCLSDLGDFAIALDKIRFLDLGKPSENRPPVNAALPSSNGRSAVLIDSKGTRYAVPSLNRLSLDSFTPTSVKFWSRTESIIPLILGEVEVDIPFEHIKAAAFAFDAARHTMETKVVLPILAAADHEIA